LHRRFKIAAITGGSIFGLLLLGAGLFKLSGAWSFSVYGKIINRVETEKPYVALTFDDGPMPSYTEEVLAILKRFNASATFFLIGIQLDENPEQGKKIVSAGHEIGNHSYTHKRMIFRTPEFIREEIEKTDKSIRGTGFEGTIHFRPPYAKRLFVLPYILKQQERLNIFMDLAPDSLSRLEGNSKGIAEYVVENAKPGSIILMHVMYKGNKASREALPLILEGLKAKGLTSVTVSELLASGKPITSAVVR
jgi:peptidoglycan-N-acetylglucosamine deacetylase